MHEPAPLEEYVPAGQAAHGPPFVEDVPAGHALHVPDPAADVCPFGHVMQLVPSADEYVPALHCLQTVEPDVPVENPTGQAEHPPFGFPYVPGPQGVHVPALPRVVDEPTLNPARFWPNGHAGGYENCVFEPLLHVELTYAVGGTVVVQGVQPPPSDPPPEKPVPTTPVAANCPAGHVDGKGEN